MDDGVKRHLIQLERERTNIGKMQVMCSDILEHNEKLFTLNADSYLKEMERMEQEGMRFVNIKKKDNKKHYWQPALAALIPIVFVASMVWFMITEYLKNPKDGPPMFIMGILVAVLLGVIIGIVLSLVQRFKEIKGGEEDVASKY